MTTSNEIFVLLEREDTRIVVVEDAATQIVALGHSGPPGPPGTISDDLLAIEALVDTGVLVRTAHNTWALRTLAGTASRVMVADGDGVAGNPTVDIAADYAGQASITTVGTVANGQWSADMVLKKESGEGIQLDPASPSWGWRDVTAAFTARTTGAQVPSLAQYGTTGIYQYQFSNGATQELFIEFHIPHDYVPGSDVFIHTHWSQATVDTGGAGGTPGAVKWQYAAIYAKGHDRQAFPAAPTVVSVVQQASVTVRQHMIAEVQLSTAGAIGGNAIEVDGVVLVRMFRNPADADDTLNVAPFAHFCDLHYQSTNMGTKQKSPDFWT